MSSSLNEPVKKMSGDSPTVQSISILEPSVCQKNSSPISTAAYFDPFSCQQPYSQEQLYGNQMYNDPFYDQPNEYSVLPTQQYYQHPLSGLGNHGVSSAIPWTVTAQHYNTLNNYDYPLYGGGYLQCSDYYNYKVTPYWDWSAQSFPYVSVMTAESTTDTHFNSDNWNSYHALQPNNLETTKNSPCSNQFEIMGSNNNSQLSSSTTQSSNNDKNDAHHTSSVYDYQWEVSESSISPLKHMKSKSDNLGRSSKKQCAGIQSYRRESDKLSTKFVITINDQHSDILHLRTGLSKKKHTPDQSNDKSQESEGLLKIDISGKKKDKKLDTPQQKLVQQKLARLLTSLRTCSRNERRELLIQKIELNLELNKILSCKFDSKHSGLGKKRKKNIWKDLEEVHYFLKTCSNMKERLRLKYLERALMHEFCNDLTFNQDNERFEPCSPRSKHRDIKSKSKEMRHKKSTQQNEEPITTATRKTSLENENIGDKRTDSTINHGIQLQRNIADHLKENHSSADNFQQHHSNEDKIEQYPNLLHQKQVPLSTQSDKCRESEKYLLSEIKVGNILRKDLREIIEARRKKFGSRKKVVDNGKKWTSFWKRKEQVESRYTDSDGILEQADDCILVPAVIPEVDLLDCETSEDDTITLESNIKPIWAIKVEGESSEDESHSQANVLNMEGSRFLPVEMLELERLQDTDNLSQIEEECNLTATIPHFNSEIDPPAPVEDEFHSPICTLNNEGRSSLSVEMLELECLQDIEAQSDLQKQLGNTMENEVKTLALIDEDIHSTAQSADSRLVKDKCFPQICAVSIEEETQSAEICRSDCQPLLSSSPNIYLGVLTNESHKSEKNTKISNTATFD